MINSQFKLPYNGQPVAVTILGYNSYMVQITYKPVRIKLENNSDGSEHWIDLDTGIETSLSNELGSLISSHLYALEQV